MISREMQNVRRHAFFLRSAPRGFFSCDDAWHGIDAQKMVSKVSLLFVLSSNATPVFTWSASIFELSSYPFYPLIWATVLVLDNVSTSPNLWQTTLLPLLEILPA